MLVMSDVNNKCYIFNETFFVFKKDKWFTGEVCLSKLQRFCQLSQQRHTIEFDFV